MTRCRTPLDPETLVSYWAGDLTSAAAESVEAHAFACADCAASLARVESIASGVPGLVDAGRLMVMGTAEILERAERDGARVRVYPIKPGESVACTITRADTFVATRAKVDLGNVERIDVEVDLETQGGVQKLALSDVPADRARGELVWLWPGDFVRSLPDTTLRIRVLSRPGEIIAQYTLNHTACV